MALNDYLPTFNYIEPNNLKGLQPGFVVAQVDNVKSDLLTKEKFLENGKICGVSVVGGKPEIHAFTSADKTMYIHYTEPLNTIVDADKYFAVNVNVEAPRLVQLIPGDEWMSTEDLGDDILGGRVIKVTDIKGWYGVSTMANGDEGFHYVFLG